MSTTLLETPRNSVRNANATVAPIDITDEYLMEQIQARNPEALGQLHDRYASMLKALLMKVLHDEAESDDMLQEVFVEIWECAGSYSPEEGKALGWIITLSRRRAIDRLREREAYCHAEGRLAEQTRESSVAPVAHVEEDVAHAEMREHFKRIIATLPLAQKQAVELAFFRGMSQREIAAYTGIPLGTIKARLELGLKKVSEALKGFEDLL